MQMIKDTRGFSSSFDVLLFLMLVSVSAVLLLPAMVSNIQLIALHDTSVTEHNSQVLGSLQDGRVDNFSYAVAGTQMDFLVTETFGPGANDSGFYQTGKKLVAGREIEHKIFADLASESVASQFNIYHADRSVRLNLLTDEYRENVDGQMRDYLDMQIGDRYNYNVSIVWRPFRDVPIGGETYMGPAVPDTAYVDSSLISMPYRTEFTRYYVEELIKDELDAIGVNLGSANEVPREETEELIAGHINDAINKTVDDAVGTIVKMTIEKTIEKAQAAVNQQMDSVVPGDNPGDNPGISDIIMNEVLAELKDDPAFIEDAGLELSEQITGYMQEVAREEAHAVIVGEVDVLASGITDQCVSNVDAVDEAKDEVLDYVFSRIDISRARMTLSLWDKNW